MAVAEFVIGCDDYMGVWEENPPKVEIENLLVRKQCSLCCVAMVHTTI